VSALPRGGDFVKPPPVDAVALYMADPMSAEELESVGYVPEYDFSKGAAEFERFKVRPAPAAALPDGAADLFLGDMREREDLNPALQPSAKRSERLYPILSPERMRAFLQDFRQAVQQGAVKLPSPRLIPSFSSRR
jgi:hypothetical protein